jgi:SnoaL-like domain
MSEMDGIVDRIAIIDSVNKHFDDVDFKNFDGFKSFYTEDVEVIWASPTGVPKTARGLNELMGMTRKMLAHDEIVTCHQVFNFTPTITGDTATANIRIRAMHKGIGSREGLFYESLGFQTTGFVRSADGWKCNTYEWKIVEKYGSFELFAGLS